MYSFFLVIQCDGSVPEKGQAEFEEYGVVGGLGYKQDARLLGDMDIGSGGDFDGDVGSQVQPKRRKLMELVTMDLLEPVRYAHVSGKASSESLISGLVEIKQGRIGHHEHFTFD